MCISTPLHVKICLYLFSYSPQTRSPALLISLFLNGVVFGIFFFVVLLVFYVLPASYQQITASIIFFMDPEALTPFNGVFASSFALL